MMPIAVRKLGANRHFRVKSRVMTALQQVKESGAFFIANVANWQNRRICLTVRATTKGRSS